MLYLTPPVFEIGRRSHGHALSPFASKADIWRCKRAAHPIL